MGRFDSSRRGKIIVWTGAAVAWGTAITIAGLEPSQASASELETPTPVAESPAAADVSAMPTQPAGGLVILRHPPSDEAEPEVRTVYVQASPAASPPAATSPAASAPAPTSSGS